MVRNACSLISAGTERQTIALAKKSLLGKAKERPDLVRKVLDKMKRDGILATLRTVRTRLDEPLALGYSCAGTVAEVGEGVTEFVPGDRVACAGSGYASHAEVVAVPKQLVAKIPEGVSFESASYVTLGAIAVQGLRQGQLTLGERVLVIGLGLLGQLTCQMVKAAGCRCIGVDTDERRVQLARELGCDLALLRTDPTLTDKIRASTEGFGPDACLITAATSSNDPIELSGELLRDRGRVIVVGLVGMEIPRRTYYEKELDVRLSRSYGPGRYDVNYEQKGVDYPIGYVRWTENRNMQSFLDLMASRKVDVSRMTTHQFKIADALEAYELVTGEKEEFSLGVLLSYPPSREKSVVRLALKERSETPATVRSRVGVGLIGGGAFARSVLIPALSKVSRARLVGIATDVPAAAKQTGQAAGFEYCTGDYHELLKDEAIQVVVIAVPHNLHAKITVEAMECGKDVHVEKPLSLTAEELQRVADVRAATGKNVLVGFNRRFSPYAEEVKKAMSGRTGPMNVLYRVNAGTMPKGHWVTDPEIGGGRILGEGCHFIDLIGYLCGSRIVEVRGRRLTTGSDSTEIWLKLADGSTGTVFYTAEGDSSFSKERFECFTDGMVAVVEDFRSGMVVRGGRSRKLRSLGQDKGHNREMELLVTAVAGVCKWPAPFAELANSTLATFAAVRSIATGESVQVEQSS